MEKLNLFLTRLPCRCMGPVRIDDSFLAFAPAMALLPQLGPYDVDCLPPFHDILFTRSAGEIPRRGWVRDALNPQSVYVSFMVATQLNVSKACAPRKRVARYIQNMVRFVLRKVPLQTRHTY
jgi:hypothetical protein